MTVNSKCIHIQKSSISMQIDDSSCHYFMESMWLYYLPHQFPAWWRNYIWRLPTCRGSSPQTSSCICCNCDANVKWSRWVSDMGAFLSTMITKSNQCRHNLTDPHAWAQYDVSNRMTLGYQLTFTNSTHIVSSHHKTTHLKYNYLCIIFSWWLGTLVYINGGHCLYCCGGTLSLFQLQLRRLQIPIQCLLWKSWKLLLVPDAFGTSKLHSCIWKKKVLS